MEPRAIGTNAASAFNAFPAFWVSGAIEMFLSSDYDRAVFVDEEGASP